MKTKDIKATDLAGTSDITAVEEVQTFTFPSLGVSVEARSQDEALEKAREIIKSRK